MKLIFGLILVCGGIAIYACSDSTEYHAKEFGKSLASDVKDAAVDAGEYAVEKGKHLAHDGAEAIVNATTEP